MNSANNTRKLRTSAITQSSNIGVSFSVKTCSDYQIDWRDCLHAITGVGIKRLRIMSYWDLHEQTKGTYDFSVLDEQLKIIESSGASATLCIGMRQPRWPETHVPTWALELDERAREEAYIQFHQAVIERYRSNPVIESWQLENEFWNKSFGQNNTFSRSRLVREFSLLRQLDPERPIIMSLGNTVGLPLFAPKPDLFGTTMYLTQYEKGRYSHTRFKPWYFALRRSLIRLVSGRDLIVHELQAEPWGPQANWEMSDEEQAESMNPVQLQSCIEFARKSGMHYMDLWGAEWWYWRKTTKQDNDLWAVIQKLST